MKTDLRCVAWERAAGAGVLGTAGILLVLQFAPRALSIKPIPLPEIAGTFIRPKNRENARKLGLGAQFVNGTSFVESYAALLALLHRESSAVTGLALGIFLWLFGTMLTMPILMKAHPLVRAGEQRNPGLFMQRLPHGSTHAAILLLGHLVFGAIAGALYKHRQNPDPSW